MRRETHRRVREGRREEIEREKERGRHRGEKMRATEGRYEID